MIDSNIDTTSNEITTFFSSMDSIEYPKEKIRKGLFELENLMIQNGNHFKGNSDNCPLKHTFSDGIYVREILIPKDTLITGRIHKHNHPFFLLEGEALVVTEEKGKEVLKAPMHMISQSGTKRAIYAISDIKLVTIHHNPTNTEDIDVLEGIAFADDYLMYEKFIENKNTSLSKLKKQIIKNISL